METKDIKIDIETYNVLRQAADAECRSIPMQIRWLVKNSNSGSVPRVVQTQIPTMNPHRSLKPQNLTSTKPRPVFLKGNQHQPKKHPSYKIPFPTLASKFPNNNNNQQNYVYKFGNPQSNLCKINEENNISFVDFEENYKKEEKIEELEKHIESLYREIKNLRYD